MNSICIWGNVALRGKVRIQGSKNAALPILASTLLTGENSYIRNCPKITDVYAMIGLLECLGCKAKWLDDGVVIDSTGVCKCDMQPELVAGMRSSLCLLGAMLGRCNEVELEYPGGCVIGARPIDLHLDALKKMGVEFSEQNGRLKAVAHRLQGTEVMLAKPSVGATENVILAAVAAEGITCLRGAAKEPEIGALCRYLVQCGARIDGIDTDCLIIEGGQKLYGTEYVVPSDRIVAGTYLFAGLATGGTIFLEKAPLRELNAVLDLGVRMGGSFCETRDGLYVQGPKRLKAVEYIRTEEYPGFPTDLQSMALVASTVAEGNTIIEETIFENRFRIVEELQKMGANIELWDNGKVKIQGVPSLEGAQVIARELRGGAALTIAGCVGKGKTIVGGCPYIDRGYENICKDFRELGARIISV